ncbi:MAG: hypothetical protein D6736_07965 [Nitrospinota bacterium]|nr:MAG: hypothetical protein D6736_07965 [Nitrospinota bacterium]
MSKRVITLLFTSGLLLITLFAVYRLIQHKQEVTITPPPPPRTVLVRVEPVVLQPRTHYVEALGTVTPFRQTRISAEVEGEVVALSPRTELGSEVKQGEELARLKDTPFRLDLEKQRALLQRQKALYQAELLASQREERLLAIARRQFQLARSEWQRKEQLW